MVVEDGLSGRLLFFDESLEVGVRGREDVELCRKAYIFHFRLNWDVFSLNGCSFQLNGRHF